MNRQAPQPSGPLPQGFRFAGVACGIKASGKPDLSLIICDQPSVAAGVYTQNQIVAAPVIHCRKNTPTPSVRGVVTNSGNANACTGEQGTKDVAAMAQQAADRIGCDAGDVLVMSTGVIGHPLPMTKVRRGIESAFADPTCDEAGFVAAADAILTTDQSRKIAFRTIDSDSPLRVAAMAKGAGMIAPNMATMLSVVCTDASLTPDDAQRLIANAARVGFNRASVDGHTSTNDTLLLLASGQGEPLTGEALQTLGAAIDEVAIELAKHLVADGEGATHVMALRVTGTEDDLGAEQIARTVAASPLVKTAITGGDPNWGRIVSAAGYAGVPISPEMTSLKICGETIYRDGTPLPFDAADLSQRMKSSAEIAIDLTVGGGSGAATFWSSDLTVEYVRFNSEYTT